MKVLKHGFTKILIFIKLIPGRSGVRGCVRRWRGRHTGNDRGGSGKSHCRRQRRTGDKNDWTDRNI